MSKPTETEIRALELAHKTQFLNLIVANKLFLKLLPRIMGKSKESKEYKAVMALAHTIAKLAGKWYARQVDYEKKAKVPKEDPNMISYLLLPKHEKDLEQVNYFYMEDLHFLVTRFLSNLKPTRLLKLNINLKKNKMAKEKITKEETTKFEIKDISTKIKITQAFSDLNDHIDSQPITQLTKD